MDEMVTKEESFREIETGEGENTFLSWKVAAIVLPRRSTEVIEINRDMNDKWVGGL
jgi:hypothetical protein